MEGFNPETQIENKDMSLDEEIYKFAEHHAGQHTMADLANRVAQNSEGRFTAEEALVSVRAQMGASFDLTSSRTVAIGGSSPSERQNRIER